MLVALPLPCRLGTPAPSGRPLTLLGTVLLRLWNPASRINKDQAALLAARIWEVPGGNLPRTRPRQLIVLVATATSIPTRKGIRRAVLPWARCSTTAHQPPEGLAARNRLRLRMTRNPDPTSSGPRLSDQFPSTWLIALYPRFPRATTTDGDGGNIPWNALRLNLFARQQSNGGRAVSKAAPNELRDNRCLE